MQFSYCLLCGGRTQIGFVVPEYSGDDLQFVTRNGSYVLPNGVIVLVDEDLSAFAEGLLFLGIS